MAKEIRFNEAARGKVLRGVNLLADTVKVDKDNTTIVDGHGGRGCHRG